MAPVVAVDGPEVRSCAARSGASESLAALPGTSSAVTMTSLRVDRRSVMDEERLQRVDAMISRYLSDVGDLIA